jgi:uncharacterized protein (UPF0335 family)
MSDSHGVARDQLRAFIERIERLEEEKKTIADDIKDVYGEAKGMGYDTVIMKRVVALRKKDDQQRMEEEQILDTYLAALGMIAQPDFFEEEPRSRNGDVKIIDRDDEDGNHLTVTVDARVASILNKQAAAPLQSPRKAAEAVSERTATIQPETANETVGGFPVAAAPTSAEETGAIQSTRQGAGMERGMDPSVTGGESAATNSEMDRATEGSFKTGSEAAEKGREAIPAGPEGVDLNHAGAGESPATIFAPASHGEAEAPSLTAADQPQAGGDDVEQDFNAATHQAGDVSESAPATPMHRSSFAHCFPELTKREYDELQDSIEVIGMKEPIIRKGDVILDGFSRYNIARSLGTEYPVVEYDGADELLDVIRWQRASRDWTPQQEAKIAKALAKEVPARAADIWAAFHLAELPDGEVVAA